MNASSQLARPACARCSGSSCSRAAASACCAPCSISPARDVHERRAQHRAQIDAVVSSKRRSSTALSAAGSSGGTSAGRDDQAVLAVRREQAADQQRIEADRPGRPRPSRRAARRSRRPRSRVERARGLQLVGEAEAAQVDIRRDRRAGGRCPAGSGARPAKVAEPLELLDGRSRPTAPARRRARSAARRPAPAASSAGPRTAA